MCGICGVVSTSRAPDAEAVADACAALRHRGPDHGAVGTLRGGRGRGRDPLGHVLPDGQPGRSLDASRAAELFGFEARVQLDQGRRRTVSWYREHRQAVAHA